MLSLVIRYLVRGGPRFRELARLMAPHRAMVAVALAILTINRVLSFALPASSRFLIDDVIGQRQLSLLRLWILVFCGVMVLEGLSAVALNQVLGRISAQAVFTLRCALFKHLSSVRLAFFDSTKSGDLASRVMSDVDRAKNLLGVALLELVGSLVSAIVGAVILFKVNPAVAAPVLLVCIAMALVSQLGLKRIRKAFSEQQKAAADLSGRLVESFAGIRFIKASRAEEHDGQVVAHLGRRVMEASTRAITVSGLITAIGSLGVGAITVFTLWMGAHQIAAGSLTLGGLMTFVTTLPMLSGPIRRLAGIGGELGAGAAAFDRMLTLFELPSEHDDKRRTVTLAAVRGAITFDDVTFAYGDGPVVLQDVSFHAPAGTMTAIVGPSGAGKSTIAALMSVLYEPCSGRVRVDQHDVSTLSLPEYRRRITQVLQDPFLFDGSIRENLLFACPHASEQQLSAACQAALVADFAEELPRGYDTVIGERGVRLSAGQKQRIAIARAILSDAQLIVLDEATSNIDAESERLILAALSRVLHGKTAFVISHRLQATRHADQILVIERGMVTGRGTHETLLACHRWYASAHETQTRAGGVPAAPVCQHAGAQT